MPTKTSAGKGGISIGFNLNFDRFNHLFNLAEPTDTNKKHTVWNKGEEISGHSIICKRK